MHSCKEEKRKALSNIILLVLSGLDGSISSKGTPLSRSPWAICGIFLCAYFPSTPRQPAPCGLHLQTCSPGSNQFTVSMNLDKLLNLSIH